LLNYCELPGYWDCRIEYMATF